jgi:hypothetical protein
MSEYIFVPVFGICRLHPISLQDVTLLIGYEYDIEQMKKLVAKRSIHSRF